MNKANNQTPPKVAPALKAGYKEIKIEKSVGEMATEIACSIYQSSETMKDIRKAIAKGHNPNTVMEYVAVMAVETAQKIKEYEKKGTTKRCH